MGAANVIVILCVDGAKPFKPDDVVGGVDGAVAVKVAGNHEGAEAELIRVECASLTVVHKK